jgi:hypothetical protein
MKLCLWDGEFRKSAVHADDQPWKHQNRGLVQTFTTGKVDAYFGTKIFLVLRGTQSTGHIRLHLATRILVLRLACSHNQSIASVRPVDRIVISAMDGLDEGSRAAKRSEREIRRFITLRHAWRQLRNSQEHGLRPWYHARVASRSITFHLPVSGVPPY